MRHVIVLLVFVGPVLACCKTVLLCSFALIGLVLVYCETMPLCLLGLFSNVIVFSVFVGLVSM